MKIKNLFRLSLLSAAVCFSLIACRNHEKALYINIEKGKDFISTNWESKVLQLEVCSNTAWEIKKETEEKWFEISHIQGDPGKTTLVLRFTENKQSARHAKLHFIYKNGSFPFTVQQSAANTNFDSPDYFFYVTFGTMPTLYAGLHMLSHNKTSFFSYERTGTFNPEKVPSHITVINGDKSSQNVMRDEIKKKILEINAEDPNAIFGFQVDDLRARLGYDWFVKQGIDSSRVKVTMLSDGTATYENFNHAFGNADSGEKNWEKYRETISSLTWENPKRITDTRALPEFESPLWSYYLSTCPNYRLLLQNKELLETNSLYIKDEMNKMKALSVSPLELLKELDAANQTVFYEMANFDRAKFEKIFNQSPKKNLIIIGTNGKDKEQKNYVKHIAQKYKTDYDIFFKPHPADKSSTNYEVEFPGLTLLPAQMPFELLLWSLMDEISLIGGYPSTVFITVPIEKIGFIFGGSPTDIFRPLNVLLKDAPHIEWL
ncbi:hypothetical protein IX307_002613 [Bacteroides pyogenes]|uniref:glycosyltransferase family 52 n=2 Tax=Bacteroides pyogenes TaxID=310300 RepID=UPI001BAB9A91|nr:glycosyltransferase family 52 [Bacteroides pyogenes]MBR8721390.1 hypothetical protein [Bacteroides pyogenes]MBR8788266.1 hypothetical protein [Bacteroides pyogenes]MBR8793769.1 hypothetical protein [Bacteroides pyogenes]MDY4248835.1 glycosyltransferase family 52 [Bacteroides pyogenes]